MKNLIGDIESEILSEHDLSLALDGACALGKLLWSADIGIYDAPAIEDDLIGRCLAIYKNTKFKRIDNCAPIVHVISEPLLTGGHTRLMEKLSGMHEDTVDLIISRRSTLRAEQRVKGYFYKTNKVSSDRSLEVVEELVGMFSSYQKLILHIHPDDICTVVACGIAKHLFNVEIFFVNHADHVFSFGTTVADYYFELSSYGRKLDAKKTIRGKKSFLGIPVGVISTPKISDVMPEKNKKLIFMSAGSDIKYKPNKGVNIFELISRILDDYSSSKFLVIGSNVKTSFWWWPLKLKYRDRLKIRSHLEIDEYQKLVAQADFYVDSHPIPGGTAFAEQYLSGRRCVGLVSSIQGYSPADKLKRNSVEEVMKCIDSYKHCSTIFDEIIAVNGIENVKQRYLDCVMRGVLSENILDSSNEWTGDVTFFRSGDHSANVNVSVATLISLQKINSGFGWRLFGCLSVQKKFKLLLKIVLAFFSLQKKVD